MTRELGPDQIAAVIVEPVQGEGGVIVPGAGFLPAVVEFCNANGIVFIADEVQSGFGRTGTMFACEAEGENGIVPDLITTAKGIAGGLPLGGVTGRAEIMDSIHGGGLGGTFGGNPIACVAALAAIDQLENGGLLERSRAIGETLMSRLRELAQHHDVIGDVRGRGAMVAIELVKGGGDKTPAPELTGKLLAACHQDGLVLLKAGTYDNVIRIMPPLVINDALLDEGLSVIEKAFASL